MIDTNSLAITVAMIALLVAAGRFLDEYHIAPGTKDRVRLALIRGFVFLDEIAIPDIPERVAALILRPNDRVTPRFLGKMIITFVAASMIYVLVEVIGAHHFQYLSLLPSLLLSSPMIVAVYVVIIVLPCFFIMRWTFSRTVESRYSIVRRASVPVAILSPLLPICACLLLIQLFGSYALLWVLYLFLLMPPLGIAAAPPVIVSAAILLIFLAKVVIGLVRRMAMIMFSAASAPTKSPFSYGATLLGVALAVVEVFRQLVGARAP